jgi:MYND finger
MDSFAIVECSNKGCHNPGTVTCKTCETAKYCGKRCQKADHKNHASDCHPPPPQPAPERTPLAPKSSITNTTSRNGSRTTTSKSEIKTATTTDVTTIHKNSSYNNSSARESEVVSGETSFLDVLRRAYMSPGFEDVGDQKEVRKLYKRAGIPPHKSEMPSIIVMNYKQFNSLIEDL